MRNAINGPASARAATKLMNPSPATAAAPATSRIGSNLAAAALGILLVNVLLVAFDVLLRWLFRMPQSWVTDIASLTYPVALACCIPAALESGHMIAIRFLGEAAGPRTTAVLDFVGNVLMTMLLMLIAWKVGERAAADWNAGYKTVNIALPLAPTWAAVTALLGVSALVQFRLTWRAGHRFAAEPRHA